ncbi:MAG: hypothetical protein PHZ26_03585 [Candidatus Gracilibacteria bacterium]|nr:hypothetical protein [Candidatus Gracilibacteria bacterium]MDD2908809.1 hypothetical protein [Candidatus Gracilibacteria bacterium]
MAGLNLSGLKINDTPLTQEETLTKQDAAPIEQTEVKVEQVAETKPSSSFTLSLSSLIGGDSVFQEDSIIDSTIETPLVENVQKEELNSQNIGISIPGIETSEIISDESSSQASDGVTISAESYDVNNTSPVEEIPVEENKEFFKNFNVIDVFSESKEIIIDTPNGEATDIINLGSIQESAIIENTNSVVSTEQIIENIATVNEIDSEEEIVNEEVIVSAAVLDTNIEENKEVINSEVVEEVASVETNSESLLIDQSSEKTEVLETPIDKIEVIDKLKKDLSGERKAGGISIFKKKSFIFSFVGVFVIAGATFGLLGLGGNDIKSNVHEVPKVEVNEVPKVEVKTAEFKEGVDYSIQVNKKKNVRKTKLILIENTGSTEQNPMIENGTGDMILENTTTDSVNSTPEEMSGSMSPENNISSESGIISEGINSPEMTIENIPSLEENNLSGSTSVQ